MKKKVLVSFLFLVIVASLFIFREKKKKINNVLNSYTELKEPLALEEMSKDKVLDFLKHGNGILFLGFPQCIWCQKYIPQLNALLLANNLKAHYYNIYVDKNDDSKFYDLVASILKEASKEVGEDLIHYNNEGRAVIYMPLTLFIKEGKIIGYEGESNDISSKDFNPNSYWTSAKKEALKERLNKYFKIVKEAMANNNANGCDNKGCEYK